MKARTRPICSSVYDKKAAKHSMKRSARARSRSSMLSQLGTHGGRGVRTVPSGTMPMASWRAKVSSRHASQPLAKRPLYRSIHSAGAWWGEWQAPVAKYKKKGSSSSTARRSPRNSMARSARSALRW